MTQGWLKQANIEEALSCPERNATRDLCTILQQRGFLNLEQASQTRRRVARKLAGLDKKTTGTWLKHRKLLRLYDLQEELFYSSHKISYKARHREFRSKVTVRYYRVGALFTDTMLSQLKDKCERIQGLYSAHIAQIYEVFQTADELILIRNFIRGRSLLETIEKSGPVAPKDAAKLFAKIARALKKTHDQGISHGWLTPKNIIINDGDPLITDFGPGESSLTIDIHALGLNLFLTLYGHEYHGVHGLEKQSKMQLPPELQEILGRCLHSDPKERFQNAGEVLFALEQYLTESKAKQPSKSWLKGKLTWLLRSRETAKSNSSETPSRSIPRPSKPSSA